jgi:hypothetical protein
MRITLIIIIFSTILHNITEGNEAKQRDFRTATIFLTVGSNYSMGSKSFFKDYNSIIGAEKSDFDVRTNFSGGIRVRISDNFRIGAVLDRHTSELKEKFSQDIILGESRYTRDISENLSVETIPVYLTFEVMPYFGQFRTYAGVGFGYALSNVSWNEKIFTNWYEDPRFSSDLYDETHFHPCITLFAGLELDFDESSDKAFVSGLMLEPRISYVFRKSKLFENLTEQFNMPPGRWYDNLPYLNGYIGINFGLIFNIHKV